MITKYKLFQNKINNFLLCVKKGDSDFSWKFSEGKKYKIYYSSIGLRIKDDNGEFCVIGHWHLKQINKTNIYTREYAGYIFTTASSIEEYEMMINMEKYNL